MTGGTEPFRYWIIDDAVKVVAADAVPPPEWSGWEVQYSNDCESGKRTARKELPGSIAGTLAALRSKESIAVWSNLLGYAVEDDPTLHGGGLHVTKAGGHLNCHLDYDRHPFLWDKRRALNLVAFVHPRWEESWGGRLLLCDPTGRPAVRIDPSPGRLVAFEVSDLSYHGVEATTENSGERISVAAYMLAPAGPHNTRCRALFVPTRCRS